MFGSGLAAGFPDDTADESGGVKPLITIVDLGPDLEVPQCVQKEAVSFTFSPHLGHTQYFSSGETGVSGTTGGVAGT